VLERYQRYLFHYRKVNGEPLRLPQSNMRGFCAAAHVVPLDDAAETTSCTIPRPELELPRLGRSLPKNIFSAAEVERVLTLWRG